MLSVILIWFYVLITTYTLGYGVLKLLTSFSFMCEMKGGKPQPYKIRFQENYIVAGLIVATVYSQVFSLFAGVGIAANILMLCACVAIAYKYRREIFLKLRSLARVLDSTNSTYIYIIVFLVMAFGASEGIMHYDTGLYHAQAIHWIEKYGIVKGLGNLHLRLAYNSAAFPLTALYSFSFTGKSYHVMSGFFALLLAWQCIDLRDIARRRHPVVPDFARLLAIYYLFTIYDEMVSPASDYFVTCLIFYIIIHWLDLNVSKEKAFVPYAFLSMVIVYAITIKLSAAAFLILMVKPIKLLIEEKEYGRRKAFFICFGFCLLIAIPFFIRNIILSGWLIYPVTAIDLFNFSWEIPKGTAEYDAREIAVYGRGYTDVTQYDIPYSQWVPQWFKNLGTTNKIMLIGDAISFVIYVIWAVALFIINRRQAYHKKHGIAEKKTKLSKGDVFKLSRRRRISMSDFLWVEFTCFAALLFWFTSAPLVRYGAMFIWLPVTLMFGKLFMAFYNRALTGRFENISYRAIIIVSLLFIAYKGIRVIVMEMPTYDINCLISQQDYETFETDSYKVNGITFYYPVEGDRAGYDPFPSAPTQGGFELRGSRLKDGFNAVQE